MTQTKPLVEKKNNLKSKSINPNFLVAGATGISGAFFYSLTPLFVFFFNDNPLTILYPIFLATIQELMSFILVATTIGLKKWNTTRNPNPHWLTYTLIVPLIYSVGVGLYSTTVTLFQKLKNARVWIVVFVGLMAGPISMSLLMMSALFLNDGTLGNIILNTAPVYCMILSHFVLKQKINRVGLISMLMTTLFTFGMLLNYFFLQNAINWKSILGVCLSFIAALMYALEGTVGDYFIHNKKLKLTNYEIVSVKSFMSFWMMLIIILPIASVIDKQTWYTGWTIFKTSFDTYSGLAILVYVSGIIMGSGRLLYFLTIKLSTGTYALATQLTMLIWTPVLQILANLLIPKINTVELVWYYWLWSGLILLGLGLITFNQDIDLWYKKVKLKVKTQISEKKNLRMELKKDKTLKDKSKNKDKQDKKKTEEIKK